MTAAVNDSRPLWQAEATLVTEVTSDMLSLGQVAELTGLKAETIKTVMHSTAHTGVRSRHRSLSRPAYDFDGIPYWDHGQVADYHRQIANRFNVREEHKHLPTLNEQSARQAELTGLHGLARVSTVPVTSLHRWKLEAGFPPPAAILEVFSPTPRLLYHWPTVRKYMKRDHAEWFIERAPNLDLNRRSVAEHDVLGDD